jgi:hypothetical protein
VAWFGKFLLRHAGDEIAEVLDRLDHLEVQVASDRMVILETADLVSYRLSQRERKRKPLADAESETEERGRTDRLADGSQRWLGAARRYGKT